MEFGSIRACCLVNVRPWIWGWGLLKEHWSEVCIRLAIKFKYQQAFSRIADYIFKSLWKHTSKQDQSTVEM